jgi:hypothetical protein
MITVIGKESEGMRQIVLSLRRKGLLEPKTRLSVLPGGYFPKFRLYGSKTVLIEVKPSARRIEFERRSRNAAFFDGLEGGGSALQSNDQKIH